MAITGDISYSRIYDSVNRFAPRGSISRTVDTCVGTITTSLKSVSGGNYQIQVKSPSGCRVEVYEGGSGSDIRTYISDGSTPIDIGYVSTGCAIIYKS